MTLMSLITHIGKRYAVYIPKKVAERLGLKEGDTLILETEDDKILLKPVRKAGTVEPWTTIESEEVEKAGEEFTRQILE